MKRYTTVIDREELIALRQQGYSYREIAKQTGWSYAEVRKVWCAYQKDWAGVDKPLPLGRPKVGSLGSFDPEVRFASLRLKVRHPRWGPEVVLAELHKQPWAHKVKLPSASSLGLYFSQFGDRLVHVRTHKQLPQAGKLAAVTWIPHSCWQLDMVERLALPGYGLVNLLDVVDMVTGIKIATQLFPAHRNGHACHVSWPQMQMTLRRAFVQWGLPQRIRTDHDLVIVAEGDYPFPKHFTLWLVGLAIQHELIRRVIENGSVERANQTWQARLDGYGPYTTLPEWQALVDFERWRMNAILPSRGRHCRRRPPLLVYPQAQVPLRYYRLQDEQQLFSLQRIYDYLDAAKWLRKTDVHGTFAFNNQHFVLGRAYAKHVVQIVHERENRFAVSCPPDNTILKTITVNGLTLSDILGSFPDI